MLEVAGVQELHGRHDIMPELNYVQEHECVSHRVDHRHSQSHLFLNSINFVVSDKQRRVRRASLTDFGFAEEEMKELDSDSDRSTEPIREAEREKKKCQDEEERQRSAKKK